MDSKEIETLAELISIKTAEKYMSITKEHIATQIKLHEANCTVKKDAKAKSFISVITSGVIGGSIVAFINWLLK